MWPLIRRFGLLALTVVALWLVSVLILNLTVFSAGGHVLSYLRAMESGDYGLAATKAGLSRAPRVLPVDIQKLSDPQIIATSSLASGNLLVQAHYELDGAQSETVFVVEPSESVLSFFDTWRFATTPLSSLQFAVIGDHRLSVNGVELDSLAMGVPPRESVLVPGVYESTWVTPWVEATEQRSVITEVDSSTSIRLRLEPTVQLVDVTVSAVESFLHDCVDQAVLQPASCPFGVTIDDRVIGEPAWTIVDYPSVTLSLSADRAAWSMFASGGVVEVDVQVQSLFDGTITNKVETFDFNLSGMVRGTTIDEPVLNLD